MSKASALIYAPKHGWVDENLLPLQGLLDGELLATVPALEVLLLCGRPLVQTLEVGRQDLLTGKAALTQQTGVILLLDDELCRHEEDTVTAKCFISVCLG